jgi:hypothetical protein
LRARGGPLHCTRQQNRCVVHAFVLYAPLDVWRQIRGLLWPAWHSVVVEENSAHLRLPEAPLCTSEKPGMFAANEAPAQRAAGSPPVDILAYLGAAAQAVLLLTLSYEASGAVVGSGLGGGAHAEGTIASMESIQSLRAATRA